MPAATSRLGLARPRRKAPAKHSRKNRSRLVQRASRWFGEPAQEAPRYGASQKRDKRKLADTAEESAAGKGISR